MRETGTSREVTDPALLRRLGEGVQRGDPKCLEALVGHFGPSLRHYLYLCVGQLETAEDLLQDTLLSAVKNCRRLRHPDRLRAWLFRIARHTALNWQRRWRRHPDMAASPLDEVVHEPVALNRARDQSHRHDLRRILDEALATLPSTEREVITLRHFEHLSSAEVAQVLNVREGTVHSRTHRGLKRMQKHMRANGLTLDELL